MGMNKRVICGVVVAICLLILLAVLLVLFLYVFKDKDSSKTSGSNGPYKHAVVAADAGKCSEIGRDIFKKNGSAVDSAIAVMFCIGIMNMHSSGIGGGGFMVVYQKAKGSAQVIDFREQAPGAANATMYVNSSLSSLKSPSASGVPGEVKGYHQAWKTYGRLQWRDVVQPSIDLAKNGVPLGEATYKAMNKKKVDILNDPGLREVFLKNNETFINEGDIIKLPKLEKTLEIIRDNPDDFYNGKLAQLIVQDVQDNGGIITLQDMKNYMVKVREPVKSILDNDKWFTAPPPASGAVLALILNILKGYNMTPADRANTKNSTLTYHRIVEAFKFAYAYRAYLGDQDFVDLNATLKTMADPQFAEALRLKINDNKTFANVSHYGGYYEPDSGSTTHMSLIAPNGDAVAITSTINHYFGCKYRSPTTGIIMNDQMDDFSTEPDKPNIFGYKPSSANFIEPGKRPLSSSSPSVFVDKRGAVRVVAGAAGGMTIITSTALTLMNYLWFGRTLSESVEDPRIHHQLIPMNAVEEKDYPMPKDILDGLEKIGHKIETDAFIGVVQTVARGDDGLLWGKSDPRKGGHSAGF